MSRKEQIRFALSQGFYMQTCRWLQQGNSKDVGGIYLTIAEGSFVKIDRQSNLKEQSHDYVVYTQLSGLVAANQNSSNSQMGIMRMVSAIEVSWVAPLLPKLKDPVDVDRLNSGTSRKDLGETSREESKQPSSASLLGKRKADTNSAQLESSTALSAQTGSG